MNAAASQQPGLPDQSSSDTNGDIGRKHGNTLMSTLRLTLRPEFFALKPHRMNSATVHATAPFLHPTRACARRRVGREPRQN